MIDDLSDLDESELSEIPDFILGQLRELAESGMLPGEEADKLNKIFGCEIKAAKNARKIRAVSDQSYVISASLGTGCYRHIQISGGATLEELSSTILDAFEFYNDHAHAFFMDNKRWSRYDSYFMSGMGGGDRTTDSYTIEETNLYAGKKFLYLFDFGDEWTFQCKVLRIEEKSTDEPIVIRSKGEAPEQYPCWE